MSWFQHTRAPATLTRIARGLVYALMFLLPLFFLPFTLDPLGINKQTILVFLTLLAVLAWLGAMHASRVISFRRGWLNAAPLLLLIAAAVSASVSRAPYLSWIGTVGQQYASGLSFLCYAAVFYLAINLLDAPEHRTAAYRSILLAAVVAGVVGILGLFGLSIPTLTSAGAWNTVGTMNALGVFLAVAAILANAWWVTHRTGGHKGKMFHLDRALIFLVSVVALAFLILLDYWILWAVFLSGFFALFLFVLVRAADFPDIGRLTLPSFLSAFALLFLFWLPSPIRTNVSVEVTPSFSGSWNIMRQTLAAAPWWGTGPGTFSFDYGRFKPSDVNATSFWNVRFDRPASWFLLVPDTMGYFGSAGWAVLVILLIVWSVGRILRAKDDQWPSVFIAFSAWFALFVGLCLYSADIAILALFFALSGLLAAACTQDPRPRSFGQSPRVGLGLSFAFVLISVGAVTLIFMTGQRYVAEIAFTRAVNLDKAKAPLDQVVNLLDEAATVNRFDDVYYRNLAQALLLKVSDQINQIKDPQQMKPEDRQRIQDLTGAAVNAAVRATDLSPDNALNWSERGSVYAALVPVVGGSAGDLAVSSFQQAIRLEPQNPEFLTDLGQAYLAIADFNRPLTNASDAAAKKAAQDKVDQAQASAEAEFNQAVALKSDYSPAHYQLALLYHAEGKLDQAISKMEQVEKYNQQDVGVAFQLGLLYLQREGTGDLARAQAALEYAVQLLPSYSNARWFLATVYEQEGQMDKAIAQMEEIAKLNPNNDMVTARLQRMKNGTDASAAAAPLGTDAGQKIGVPSGQPTKK